MLIIFSGLPAVGKSTIARELAKRLGAVYLRADTIEQAMRNWFPDHEITREGYEIAYTIAAENLALGLRVIADSVNPFAITRDTWRDTALAQGATYLEVEVVCSDKAEHRKRVEQRVSDIPGLKLPTWDEVVSRDYEPWTRKHLVIDTATANVSTAVDDIERMVMCLEKGLRLETAMAFANSMKQYDELYRQLAK